MWWKVGRDATGHIPNDEASICTIYCGYLCLWDNFCWRGWNSNENIIVQSWDGVFCQFINACIGNNVSEQNQSTKWTVQSSECFHLECWIKSPISNPRRFLLALSAFSTSTDQFWNQPGYSLNNREVIFCLNTRFIKAYFFCLLKD